MKYILKAKIINGYRAKGKFYSKVRGHTGEDLNYKYEDLPSPVTGVVLLAVKQNEMGNVLYIKDLNDYIHVFAHLEVFKVKKGDKVLRNQIIAKTGNTGTATTGAHLHYEVLTPKPRNPIDVIMYRKELMFKGFNTDPTNYIWDLYKLHNLDADGNLLPAKA